MIGGRFHGNGARCKSTSFRSLATSPPGAPVANGSTPARLLPPCGIRRSSLGSPRSTSKMSTGECMAGTAFKIKFETLRPLNGFERDIGFQFPWCIPGRVNTFAGVMFKHALLQIGGMSNVLFPGTVEAFNDVRVKHHINLPTLACHP